MHGPGQGYTIDDVASIRRNVADKASAYGRLDTPYVIALRVETFLGKDHSIIDALFGQEQVTLETSSSGMVEVSPGRARNGVWNGPRGFQNRRVSAVLTADWLGLTTIPRTVPTLWHNPVAEHPIQIDSAPWRHAVIDTEGELKMHDPFISVATFFGLPETWPGPEPSFPF